MPVSLNITTETLPLMTSNFIYKNTYRGRLGGWDAVGLGVDGDMASLDAFLFVFDGHSEALLQQ